MRKNRKAYFHTHTHIYIFNILPKYSPFHDGKDSLSTVVKCRNEEECANENPFELYQGKHSEKACMDHKDFEQLYVLPNFAPNNWMPININKKHAWITWNLDKSVACVKLVNPRMLRPLALDKTDSHQWVLQ